MMSFLSELQIYVGRYRPTLSSIGYSEVRSFDGPGMGAVITFANSETEFDLTNDRGQFLVDLHRTGDTKNCFDLSVFLALRAVTEAKKDISKMSFEEKTLYWTISYSYSDPIVELLRHLDFAEDALADEKLAMTKAWAREYCRRRGDWLSPRRPKGAR